MIAADNKTTEGSRVRRFEKKGVSLEGAHNILDTKLTHSPRLCTIVHAHS